MLNFDDQLAPPDGAELAALAGIEAGLRFDEHVVIQKTRP